MGVASVTSCTLNGYVAYTTVLQVGQGLQGELQATPVLIAEGERPQGQGKLFQRIPTHFQHKLCVGKILKGARQWKLVKWLR